MLGSLAARSEIGLDTFPPDPPIRRRHAVDGTPTTGPIMSLIVGRRPIHLEYWAVCAVREASQPGRQ